MIFPIPIPKKQRRETQKRPMKSFSSIPCHIPLDPTKIPELSRNSSPPHSRSCTWEPRSAFAVARRDTRSVACEAQRIHYVVRGLKRGVFHKWGKTMVILVENYDGFGHKWDTSNIWKWRLSTFSGSVWIYRVWRFNGFNDGLWWLIVIHNGMEVS